MTAANRQKHAVDSIALRRLSLSSRLPLGHLITFYSAMAATVPKIITTTATPPAVSPSRLHGEDDPLGRMSEEVGLATMMEELPPPVSRSSTTRLADFAGFTASQTLPHLYCMCYPLQRALHDP